MRSYWRTSNSPCVISFCLQPLCMYIQNNREKLRVDSLGMPMSISCCTASELYPALWREFSGVILKLPLNGWWPVWQTDSHMEMRSMSVCVWLLLWLTWPRSVTGVTALTLHWPCHPLCQQTCIHQSLTLTKNHCHLYIYLCPVVEKWQAHELECFDCLSNRVL